MAVSTCVKCGEKDQFEVVLKESIPGTNYKLAFVQCARCGGVVGVLDYYNILRREDME
jgi:uncharacterized Zn finger protein